MDSNPVVRPGGLSALCILAMVLGALGILTGLAGIAAAALQGPLQDLAAQMQPAGDENAAELQQQIAEESREFAQRHAIRNIVFSMAKLLVASSLLLGGIFAFRLRIPGRKLLLFGFAAGIAFELCQIWPMIEVAQFTGRIMEAQQQVVIGQNADDAMGTMRIMMKVMAAMQLAMLAAMVLVKTVFYGFGLWYLTRPHVAALYVRPIAAEGPTSPEGEWR